MLSIFTCIFICVVVYYIHVYAWYIHVHENMLGISMWICLVSRCRRLGGCIQPSTGRYLASPYMTHWFPNRKKFWNPHGERMLNIALETWWIMCTCFGAKTSRYFGAKPISLDPHGHLRQVHPTFWPVAPHIVHHRFAQESPLFAG